MEYEIKTRVINEHANIDEKTKIEMSNMLIIASNWSPLPIDLYIETPEDFFKANPEIPQELWNPIEKKLKPTRAWSRVENNIWTISLLIDRGCMICVLYHEMTHLLQYKILGDELYRKVMSIYSDKRSDDPLELQAYMNESKCHNYKTEDSVKNLVDLLTSIRSDVGSINVKIDHLRRHLGDRSF
jgi:hypothetical protein